MPTNRLTAVPPPRLPGCAMFVSIMAALLALAGVGIVLLARDLLGGQYHEIGEEPPLYITEYNAVIGPEDKVDDAGKLLASDQMILARDRENVEDRGIRQPGDGMSYRRPSADNRSLPHSPANRWSILENAHISATEEARQTLQAGRRPIHITIYFNERYDRYIASIKLFEAAGTR